VLRIWGYFKTDLLAKFPDPFKITGEKIDRGKLDFADQYSYAQEELDLNIPKPMGKEMAISVFFDGDVITPFI
jgi:hypothetical protein